jgi:hypothetical protein
MAKHYIYGLGGYCPDCNPDIHNHPMNNLVEIEDIPDLVLEDNNVQQIAEALSSLPQETLDALKKALGI